MWVSDSGADLDDPNFKIREYGSRYECGFGNSAKNNSNI